MLAFTKRNFALPDCGGRLLSFSTTACVEPARPVTKIELSLAGANVGVTDAIGEPGVAVASNVTVWVAAVTVLEPVGCGYATLLKSAVPSTSTLMLPA